MGRGMDGEVAVEDLAVGITTGRCGKMVAVGGVEQLQHNHSFCSRRPRADVLFDVDGAHDVLAVLLITALRVPLVAQDKRAVRTRPLTSSCLLVAHPKLAQAGGRNSMNESRDMQGTRRERRPDTVAGVGALQVIVHQRRAFQEAHAHCHAGLFDDVQYLLRGHLVAHDDHEHLMLAVVCMEELHRPHAHVSDVARLHARSLMSGTEQEARAQMRIKKLRLMRSNVDDT